MGVHALPKPAFLDLTRLDHLLEEEAPKLCQLEVDAWWYSLESLWI